MFAVTKMLLMGSYTEGKDTGENGLKWKGEVEQTEKTMDIDGNGNSYIEWKSKPW